MNPIEGVIKFRPVRLAGTATPDQQTLGMLNGARRVLWERRLIGETEHGVGYGNISLTAGPGPGKSFWITGTQTGACADLQPAQYCLVESCNSSSFEVLYRGEIAPSSESFTHAAVYGASNATCVIHVHHLAMWAALLADEGLTTATGEYGTLALASNIEALASRPSNNYRLIAMAGHEGGILIFGAEMQRLLGSVIKVHDRFL